MDAKQILKELIQSVNKIDLYNFLLLYSNIGIKSENEVYNETDYEEIRHDQINAWIDKAIKAAYEKPEENKLPSIEDTTKDFPTLAVLSVTSGRLLTQPKDANEGNGIDQMYEVLGWMTDDLPFTDEECKQWIYQWHPEIIEADKMIENKLIERCEAEDVKDCQTAMLAKFGETITLQKIPQGYHNFKKSVGVTK